MGIDRRGGNTAALGLVTRERILDVAESLFAEKGPEAVSVRAIAAGAEVNIAAVNYHFGTKERLFEQIFKRRVVPLNEERLLLLAEAIASAGPSGVPRLENILTAFIGPPLRFSASATNSARALVVMQFLGHAFSSPNEGAFLEAYYEDVRTRFVDALTKACPDLGLSEIVARYNFIAGAIAYAMGGPARLNRLPKGLKAKSFKPLSEEGLVREFVAFAAAGFREISGNSKPASTDA
jgi:AcrR family transcriptional regulator